MGILNEFEEKEEIQEKEPKTVLSEADLQKFVKEIVKAELNVVSEFLKTKTAEYILEQQNSKKLQQEIEEYAKVNEVFKDTILSKMEKFSKDFTEKLQALQDINENFVVSLEKSKFLERLEKTIQSTVYELGRDKKKKEEELNDKLLEIANRADSEIQQTKEKFSTLYLIQNIVPWILTVLCVVIMAFQYFSVRSRLASVDQRINRIENILTGDVKYWYSKAEKQAYMLNLEEIEKRKKEEEKK